MQASASRIVRPARAALQPQQLAAQRRGVATARGWRHVSTLHQQNEERKMTKSDKERRDSGTLRRSLHFVPGNNHKLLDTCLNLGADSLILDLEDTVADDFKELGLKEVTEFLNEKVPHDREEDAAQIHQMIQAELDELEMEALLSVPPGQQQDPSV